MLNAVLALPFQSCSITYAYKFALFWTQVERLSSADEHLLYVVIAVSRHSPAAAKAVMKCPRLMDSIIQRFLLTDEDLNSGLRPAHTNAIRLLKVCFPCLSDFCTTLIFPLISDCLFTYL